MKSENQTEMPTWNSLEVVKLIVSFCTPLAVAILGIYINRRLRQIESMKWANQTLLSYRAEVFKSVAPQLNQLLCFATFVGNWKKLSPRDAINIKRSIDEVMYSNRPLLSNDLFVAYQRFIASIFKMYANTNADALVRAPIDSDWGDRRSLPWWGTEMAELFVPDDQAGSNDIFQLYDALSQRWRMDLYVTDTAQPLISDYRT